ncbi:MAG: carbohydrate binding family 9 domain-containing protein [Cytophagaceae bacterium]|nr:carbohydrate binding family 9 domain-containing protein [Cytophagaceae bacterium]
MRYVLPVLLFLSTSAFSQAVFQPDSIKRQLQATKIERSLRVDGRLNEVEWQQALPTSKFVQIEPYQRQPANHDTQVRLLYNRDFLYVAAFMQDSLGRKALRVPNLKRDFTYGSSDIIGVSVDGFHDGRNAMMFAANPYGSQRDLLSFDDAIIDEDWDGLWRVRTSRTDSGWVAEMAIPWQTLRYQRTDTAQTWGINFFRIRRATNELTTWSAIPRAFSPLRMPYAGILSGIEAPPARANVRFQPYLLVSDDRNNGSEIGQRHQTQVKAGGELKWAINPSTVLDLTVNTDFAQADADRQVNNLTRLSVFFPERRPFFLENAGLFGVGLSPIQGFWGGQMIVRPFFSRRIGLDDAGRPVPIDAGARLVYRSLRRNAGVLYMRQREGDGSLATNYFVGRFSENFGTQNRLGGLLTMKNTAAYTNLTGSVDGFFRLRPSLSLTTMVSLSGNTASPTGTPPGNGFFGYYQLYNRSNQWVWWVNQAITTKNYNPEVGFVSRANVVETTPGFYWLGRGKFLPAWIRATEPGGFVLTYHQASTGRLIERQYNLNPLWFMLQSGGYLGGFINGYYQRLDEPFSPVGIAIARGKYRYWRYNLLLGSDRSRKVSYSASIDWGGYYNGRLTTTALGLTLAPLPHISAVLSWQSNQFGAVGLARESTNVQLFSVETRLALNPRLQLIGFYQFNTASRRDLYNIRLSWEYQPLSFLYLVFNQRAYDDFLTHVMPDGHRHVTGDLARQREQHLIGKISYLKQF